MEGEKFVCSLCCFYSDNFNEFSKHFVRNHKNDPNFAVSCAVGSCEFTTRNWGSFKVHVHRKHKISDDPDENNVHEPMNVEPIECVPFNDRDNLGHYNSLYAMSLEAKYNLTQTAIDHVISSTCTLLDAQLDYFKRQLKTELESRNIATDVVNSIDMSHMLNDFDSSAKRYNFYEKCSDLPYVKPEDVALGEKHVIKNNELK